ncbi:OsmC family protein [Parapedobacter sp. ISTM3]|uniref:Osmotically inducible protein OsmC n=1 Tax=Parapedobacter luteus TaxID=623280 RepID=A0A1T5CA07_9SPHI|nr:MULTISPECIES: OsmC family protein [Parapedobacter]MBK1439133.1 OsmC family protein [Parapedobacter sp. ISTM3]SKB56265.1 osmotically inducible protein OsmC [Parapedobacter luteus]
MKFTRNASANWKGTGKDGSGTLTTQSTVLDQTQYSYKTRFEDGVGTNPEELIGAAHAGCFTMQLSFLLSEKGYQPTSLDTEAKVIFEDGTITTVQLALTGEVDGIDEAEFKEIAEKAKEICPVSKLLKATIELTVTLA